MSQSKIVTVTLHPSLDETITINHLNLGYHNRSADSMQLDASGRGVNVSHALSQLQVNTHAVVLLGTDAIGHAYKGLISEQAFDVSILRHAQHTRSDTIIYDQSDNSETHIIDDCIGIDETSIESIIATLRDLVNQDDYVVLAGTLPRELKANTYGRIAEALQETDAKIILMAGSDMIDPVLKYKTEMVVLSRLETESYFNYPVRTVSDMLICGHKLKEKGARKVLIIEDDFSGAVFSNDEQFNLKILTENSGTDSGVIDAMVAGYLAGMLQGEDNNKALERGAAALIYTSNQVGNRFATPSDIDALKQDVTVQQITHDLPVTNG